MMAFLSVGVAKIVASKLGGVIELHSPGRSKYQLTIFGIGCQSVDQNFRKIVSSRNAIKEPCVHAGYVEGLGR